MGAAFLVCICLVTGGTGGGQVLLGQARQGAGPPRLEHSGDPYLAPQSNKTSPRMMASFGSFSSVQVNVDELGNNIVGDAANEPSIGISPANPNAIVVGWRQFDNVLSNFRQAGWGYSHDAGATWTFPGVLTPGVFRSDPVLGSDTIGNIYYYSLTVNGNDWHCDTFVSADGGVTWSAPHFSFGGDKNWFTVDKSGGVGHGFLHGVWSTAGNNYFPNQFSRSTNAGVNWMNPVQLSPNQQVWGTLTVDPNGDLYISGQRNNLIYVSKSSNAKFGAVTPTFDFTVNVPLGGVFASFNGPNPGGLVGQVWVASDHSTGPTRGNVYLLCSVDPPGTDPLDVFFARSQDGGMTWSAPVRVNDDLPIANAWQWFGTMSVAPNGRIDVVWNDTRASLLTNMCRTFYSHSLDGGRTWSKNVAMTPTWNSVIGWPNQNKIGDYYDMVSDATGAGLAYAATFNGEQDVYYLRIDPAPPVMPQSFLLFRGGLLSGGLPSLFGSDDDRLVARAGLTISSSESPLQIVVQGTSPAASPLELGFLLESRVNTTNLAQKIEMFNYVTGQWEAVDTRAATSGDSITHVLVSTNPARFINAADLQVRTKISYKATGLTVVYPWSASLDRANWTVLQ